MWKRLDRASSYSEKFPSISDIAFRVWVHVLPWADCEGRFIADPAVIKGQCLIKYTFRLTQVFQALLELDSKGLIHLYDIEGKKYLVYHDHADYNPPGRLKNQAAEWPAPPSSVKCKCVVGRSALGVAHGDCPSVPSCHVPSGGSGGAPPPSTAACERCRGLGLVQVLLVHDRHGDTQVMFPCPVCKPDAFELATPMLQKDGWKLPPREADRRKA